MNAEIEKVACEFFGYGRWDAPYWFIGPEPGGTGNQKRAETFIALQKEKSQPDGLCDCKEFHRRIEEKRWHFDDPVKLQPTWRRLMMFLKAFLNQDTSQLSLRAYQRDHWGMSRGRTCVIDLSGLSAPRLTATQPDRVLVEPNIESRIQAIRKKIQENQKEIKLVVMYGFSAEKHWKKIAGPDLQLVRNDAAKGSIGSIRFVYTQHPVARPRKDSNCLACDTDWISLGETTRERLMQ